MGTITEIQALQNAATSLGLTIYEKFQEDKRRTVGRYFAQNGNSTVSPVLDYEQMNHFLLGWGRAIKHISPVLTKCANSLQSLSEADCFDEQDELALEMAEQILTKTA